MKRFAKLYGLLFFLLLAFLPGGYAQPSKAITYDWFQNYGSNQQIVFDSEYQAVLDRATTLGYTKPSAAQQIKQNQLIVSLKAAGIWNLLDVFYVFATDGSSDFATLNWINPSLYQCSKVNSPTFTTNKGFKGNGTTNYLDTNYNYTINGINYTINSASRGLWQYSIGTVGHYFDGQTGSAFNCLTYNSSSSLQRINLSTSLGSFTFSNLNYIGINRSSATSHEVYQNNSQTLFTGTPPAGSSSANFVILRSNFGFGNMGISMWYAGGNMNITKHNSFNSIFSTYFISL